MYRKQLLLGGVEHWSKNDLIEEILRSIGSKDLVKIQGIFFS